MMKRFLLAALLACAFVGQASAVVNQRQNGDGTADWVGASDTKRFGNCVGGTQVQIPTQLNNTASTFGISPISNAVIRGAYAVTPATTTGTANLRIYVNQTASPVTFFSGSNSSTTPAYLRFTGAAAGTVARISTIGEVGAASGMVRHTVQEGDYIGIGTDGGATGLATAQVFIQLCPR